MIQCLLRGCNSILHVSVYILLSTQTYLVLEADERVLGVVEAGGAVRVQLPHSHTLPALDAHTRPVQRQTSAV